MKKTILILTVILSTFVINAQNIIRVNNNPGINADFTTLQDAHDAASSGDTIYLEHSPTSYGDCSITKQLVVFGTGYFLAENDSTPQQTTTAIVNNISLSAGAENTVVSGLTINGIYVSADNITIRRNKISEIYLGFFSVIGNSIIVQNYVNYIFSNDQTASNSIINNNIISGYIAQTIGSATITNNIFNTSSGHDNTTINSTVHNNIFYQANINTTNTDLRNNLFSVAGTDINGNQYNIDMATVFLLTGSTDGQWKLAPGSPAIGAAIDGGDCGAFGGLTPYRLSGVPAVPYIYEAIIPTAGTTSAGLPVSVKIRSNN